MAALCVLLISVAPMTTEAFVPAMPLATAQLSFGTVEGSVSMFLAIGATGHLAHGWLISRKGVLPVSLYALCVYAAGSTIVWAGASFWAGRAMQSLGASGCTVAGFSLLKESGDVRKVVPRAHFARALVLVAVPMASEAISSRMGWKACFGALAACGFIGVCLVVAEWPKRKKAHSHSAKGGYEPIKYALWVATDACSFASMFLWIAFAPFLVGDVEGFGYWYGCTFLGSALGSLLAMRTSPLAGTLGSQALMACMAIVAAAAPWRAWVFVWMALLNCARGVTAAHAQAKSLAFGPNTPGYAAGVLNSARLAVTSLAVLWAIYSPTWALIVGFALAPLLLHMAVLIFSGSIRGRALDATTQLNVAPNSSSVPC